jgi:polyphosphate kinase 2
MEKLKKEKKKKKHDSDSDSDSDTGEMSKKELKKDLRKLQRQLIDLQETIIRDKLRVAVVFEGRDTAGKGGVINTITSVMNPRIVKHIALAKPTDVEKSQWYFQRYAQYLPAAGEMVLFDRSWYNRAGVERVMGFCSEEEYQEFLVSAPEFERLLQRSGIILIKYWLSVSFKEQTRRLQRRIDNPAKNWKLSPMDMESHVRWNDYSKAKDAMLVATDTDESPWFHVHADNKLICRLNLLAHLLSVLPHQHVDSPPMELPEAPPVDDSERIDEKRLRFVAAIY